MFTHLNAFVPTSAGLQCLALTCIPNFFLRSGDYELVIIRPPVSAAIFQLLLLGLLRFASPPFSPEVCFIIVFLISSTLCLPFDGHYFIGSFESDQEKGP